MPELDKIRSTAKKAGKEEVVEKIDANERLKDLCDDLDNSRSIAMMLETDGGKKLVEYLKGSIVSTLSSIKGQYRLASRDELVTMISDFVSKQEIIKQLYSAKASGTALQEMIDEEMKKMIETV